MIDFRLNRNRTGHEDIVFLLGSYSRICDSYYFFVDYTFDPDDESVDKALKVMRKLLQQWINAVDSLVEGQIIYLPFEFSDQYTGCVECTLSQDEILISAGYSNREAWRSWPNNISTYINSINDFKAFKEFANCVVKMAKSRFREDVTRAIERLGN